MPQERGITSPLWTRRAVRDLIQQMFGIAMLRANRGRILEALGIHAEETAAARVIKDPDEVQEWLEKIYPPLRNWRAQEDAEILWCDETGVDSNDHVGSGYALVGETPTIEVSSSPCRMNLILRDQQRRRSCVL